MSLARAIAKDLAKLLTDCEAPVYLVDEDRTIVFANAACGRLLGIEPATLIGQVCAFHTPEDQAEASAAAAALCPAPGALAGGAQSAVLSFTLPKGATVRRRAYFLPLAEGADECAPVLAVLETHEPADDNAEIARADTALHDEVRHCRALLAASYRPASLLGHSPAVVRARTQIELAAASRASVLVVGPPGSGTSHVAKAIHYSQREPGTLVGVDCRTLETNLVRSTLRSLLSRAMAGKEPATLLLFEVDCLNCEAQSDLPPILKRVAGDVRVVCTSRAGASQLVADKRMPAELACQLSTLVIELPPLAERLEDVPLLAQSFLEEINRQGLKQVGGFSAAALARLVGYPWKGNLDELAEAVREAHARARVAEVAVEDLPYRIEASAQAAAHPKRRDEAIQLEAFLARIERELIERAMRRAKNNKTKAARLLGLSRPRLYRRLVQLGLEKSDGEATE